MIQTSQIERWLAEDVGHHDVTNAVPGRTEGTLIAREECVVAGLTAAEQVYEYLGIDVEPAVSTGTVVEAGDDILTATGSTQSLLRGERIVVNLVGHLSGIATKTRHAVEAARTVSPSVQIAGTRKTTPGLRGLEKRAIVAGGGDTHRLDLSHMAMLKENHVEAMGLEAAIEQLTERVSFATKLEVEVESADDAVTAATAGADVVMLDNCSPDVVEEAVERLPSSDVLLEASGGISIESVPEYAATGVDVISLGSLTHSAPSIDCSFTME